MRMQLKIHINFSPTATSKRPQCRHSDIGSSTIDDTTHKKSKLDNQTTSQATLATGLTNAIIEFCQSEENIYKSQNEELVEFVSALQVQKNQGYLSTTTPGTRTISLTR